MTVFLFSASVDYPSLGAVVAISLPFSFVDAAFPSSRLSFLKSAPRSHNIISFVLSSFSFLAGLVRKMLSALEYIGILIALETL